MKTRALIGMLAAGLFGAALAVPPVYAKCAKECKHGIIDAFHSCKLDCKPIPDKASKKLCKKNCVMLKNEALKACKAAVAPACSPSGAFLEF